MNNFTYVCSIRRVISCLGPQWSGYTSSTYTKDINEVAVMDRFGRSGG